MLETWAIVAIVLGSNIIVALSTFFATKMQVSHSDKRFEREFEKTITFDDRQRRREIRGEPLLKLRNELAIMAVKLEDLVASAQRTHTRFGGTQEEVEKKLHKAVDDWNAYLANGGMAQTLFIQYDTELVNRVEEIRKDYQQAYFHNLNFRDSNAEDMKEAFNIFKKNKARIIEAQALINGKLEEL